MQAKSLLKTRRRRWWGLAGLALLEVAIAGLAWTGWGGLDWWRFSLPWLVCLPGLAVLQFWQEGVLIGAVEAREGTRSNREARFRASLLRPANHWHRVQMAIVWIGIVAVITTFLAWLFFLPESSPLGPSLIVQIAAQQYYRHYGMLRGAVESNGVGALRAASA
jgi:hypothetical protein